MVAAKEKILVRLKANQLSTPSSETRTLVDLSHEITTALSNKTVKDNPNKLWRFEKEHLIFVLIDGMGCNFIDILESTSFLKTHPYEKIQSIVPSATTAALTSLCTGKWPTEHGAWGWWLYEPSLDAHIKPLPWTNRFEDAPIAHGIKDIFLKDSGFAGQKSRSASFHYPNQICNTPYSNYYSGSAKHHGYSQLNDAVIQTVTLIDRAVEPEFHSIYFPDLDSTSHQYGTSHEKTRAVLKGVDKALAKLIREIDGRADIIITADHGHLDVPKENAYCIGPEDELMALLRTAPSCEPRMPAFHVKDGKREEFIDLFNDRYGQDFLLIPPADAAELGILGPKVPHPVALSRLGDFIGIALNPATLEFTESPSTYQPHKAVHGGLTPQEMEIPVFHL